MRRSGFLSVFLLLLPAAFTLADPAPAADSTAPAAAVPAAPAAKKAERRSASAAPVQPVFPEVLFRPILRAKENPDTFADPARAAELFLTREQLIQNLLMERRRILTSDPKAREIHAKIVELNKQLAVVLESKRAVRELTRDLMLIDARIDSLERKAPPVPVPAETSEKADSPAPTPAAAAPATATVTQPPASAPAAPAPATATVTQAPASAPVATTQEMK